jgi:hypothetical protein
MSRMDGRAFGSLVAAATMATNACGSIGERIVRGTRIRLFQDTRESIQRSTEVQGTGTAELLGRGVMLLERESFRITSSEGWS